VFTEVNEVTRIIWIIVLKIGLSAELLPIWIFNKSRQECLITKVIHLLQQHAANHLPYREGRSSQTGIINSELFLYFFPVYFLSKKYQFMLHVYHVKQRCPEDIQLWTAWNFSFHFCQVLIEFTDYLANALNMISILNVNNQHFKFFLRID
jgi:hypothetical protein